MIEGVVNSSYEAVIPLSLQGPVGLPQELEAVIDIHRIFLPRKTPTVNDLLQL